MTQCVPARLLLFAADNADVKFPWRLPIQNETHELPIYDVKRHPSCGLRSAHDQALDMQAVMAAIAGYFGGYTSKMQPIGERETRQLCEAAQRKVEGERRASAWRKVWTRKARSARLWRAPSSPCARTILTC